MVYYSSLNDFVIYSSYNPHTYRYADEENNSNNYFDPYWLRYAFKFSTNAC